MSCFDTSTDIRERVCKVKEGNWRTKHRSGLWFFGFLQCPSEKDPSSGASRSGPQWKQQSALAGSRVDSHLCIKSILAVGRVPATVP